MKKKKYKTFFGTLLKWSLLLFFFISLNAQLLSTGYCHENGINFFIFFFYHIQETCVHCLINTTTSINLQYTTAVPGLLRFQN